MILNVSGERERERKLEKAAHTRSFYCFSFATSVDARPRVSYYVQAKGYELDMAREVSRAHAL